MKTALSRLLAVITPLLILPSCSDKGSDEPNPAILYDICEVAPDASSTQPILHLYRPDSDTPVILTIQSGALGTTIPDPGTAILAAYTPADGQPYTSGPVTLHSWYAINNIPLQEADTTDDLQGWDTDPVWLLSAWRAGGKICMRLRLSYDTTPRLFALILDPTTVDDPIPTAYLYHTRPADTPTFDRQYYVAFDIASLWSLPTTDGLRIRLANSASPTLTTLLFTK